MDIKLSLTFNEALNIHGACIMAVQHYAKIVAAYSAGEAADDTRAYFEKRLHESEAAEQLLKRALHNTKWETQPIGSAT